VPAPQRQCKRAWAGRSCGKRGVEGAFVPSVSPAPVHQLAPTGAPAQVGRRASSIPPQTIRVAGADGLPQCGVNFSPHVQLKCRYVTNLTSGIIANLTHPEPNEMTTRKATSC